MYRVTRILEKSKRMLGRGDQPEILVQERGESFMSQPSAVIVDSFMSTDTKTRVGQGEI